MSDQVIFTPSWEQCAHGMQSIVNSINGVRWKFDAVVGLSRGGLIPAVVLSHKLKTPLIPISYSSKNGAGDDKNHSNNIPTLPTDIIRVLIVDDLVDTGHTLKEVTDALTNQGCEVSTACLYFKETSVIPPMFYWQYVPTEMCSEWIVFPWENS